MAGKRVETAVGGDNVDDEKAKGEGDDDVNAGRVLVSGGNASIWMQS